MKYYNGLNDIVFKNTLCVEEHKGLLKWLLESCLDIKIDNLILKDKENELNSDDDFVTFISREEDQEKTENALRTIISEKNEELKIQKTKLNIEHAKKLKENNVDVKIISDTTGLTIEEIEKL